MATLCRSLTNATCVPNSRLCSYYLDRENSNDHTSPATMIAQGSGSLDSKAGCLAGKKWIIDLASAQLERKSYWFCICTAKKPTKLYAYRGSSPYANLNTAIFQNFSDIFGYCVFGAKIFHYCNFYDIAKYRKSGSNEIFWPKKCISQIFGWCEFWLMWIFPRTKSLIRQEPPV